MWVDSHCHLDAREFDADRQEVIKRAHLAGVMQMVIPAVAAPHFPHVVQLAHQHQCAYALGIHPLWIADETQALPTDQDAQAIAQLHKALSLHHTDQRLVAIGEIGLDYFDTHISHERQWFYYTEQLKLARAFKLPVILHVRKSADMLLKGLHQHTITQGIAHAFNGSDQQAHAFLKIGFKLGFGGACTFERARQIRHLAQALPAQGIVLETDAPDMPPQWLYQTARQRLQGTAQSRNEPSELPRIAQTVAALRAIPAQTLQQITTQNTLEALPKLQQLV